MYHNPVSFASAIVLREMFNLEAVQLGGSREAVNIKIDGKNI